MSLASSSLALFEPPALLWLALAVAGLLLLGGLAWLALRALGLLTEIRSAQARLDRLDDLTATVERWVSQRQEVDLGRIEHGLASLRDGQARFEASVLGLVETLTADRPVELTPIASAPRADLAERIWNRLLAQGYTQIEIITGRVELGAIEDDGVVQVEARRDGVVYKGAVRIQGGRIVDLALQPAFTMFP